MEAHPDPHHTAVTRGELHGSVVDDVNRLLVTVWGAEGFPAEFLLQSYDVSTATTHGLRCATAGKRVGASTLTSATQRRHLVPTQEVRRALLLLP